MVIFHLERRTTATTATFSLQILIECKGPLCGNKFKTVFPLWHDEREREKSAPDRGHNHHLNVNFTEVHRERER